MHAAIRVRLAGTGGGPFSHCPGAPISDPAGGLRPIYYRRADRIEAHLFVAFHWNCWTCACHHRQPGTTAGVPVIAAILAPRGRNFIAFFDDRFRYLGKIGYVSSRPLWCEGSRLYLFGELDGFATGLSGNVSPMGSRISRPVTLALTGVRGYR